MSTTRNLPTIRLDTTLTELYRRASPKYAHKHIAQVMGPVNSAVQLAPSIPRNVKYLYQDSTFNESERTGGAYELSSQARRELAIEYIALAPQRDAFLSGDTTVVLFSLGDDDAQQAHDKNESQRTLSILSERQRPKLVLCSSPAEIPVERENIDLIAYKLSADYLEGHNLITTLDSSWHTNAKGALAKSGLPTPRCDVIEVDGLGYEPDLCCDACRARSESRLILVDCTGQRGRWFSEQSSGIYQRLSARPLPYVFKNQQSYGGAGTYLIHSEPEHEKLLRDLRNGVLRRMLSYITEANRHLQPAAMILSELIENLTATRGLSFFVTEDREPVFLAVTEHYIGPVGVDILETVSSGEIRNGMGAAADEQSNFHILDINARTSGQLCLPLFRTHFTSRGYQSAATLFIKVLKKRDEFIEMFKDDFESGKICIISWYDDLELEASFGNVVLGAENVDKLEEDTQRIRDISQEVTF